MLACIALLEEAIQLCLQTRKGIKLPVDWEAPHEAQRLMYLVIRHTEGVIAMARSDLVLLPPAMAAARSAQDCGAWAMWLMEPATPEEREVRWLAKLEEYRNRVNKLITLWSAKGHNTDHLKDLAKELRDKYDDKLKILPLVLVVPDAKRISVESILHKANVKDPHANYMLGSQLSHGGMMGTEIYRYDVGDNSPTPEMSPNIWYLPFYICWHALGLSWTTFLSGNGGDLTVFPSSGIEDRILGALDRLRTAPDPSGS